MRAVETLIVVLRPDAQDLEGTGRHRPGGTPAGGAAACCSWSIRCRRTASVPGGQGTGRRQTFGSEVLAVHSAGGGVHELRQSDGLSCCGTRSHPVSLALQHVRCAMNGRNAAQVDSVADSAIAA